MSQQMREACQSINVCRSCPTSDECCPSTLHRWHHNVLAAADPAYQPATDANRPPAPATAQPNPQLLRLGVREDVCQGLLNPGE